MAKQILTRLLDDLDGTEADETLTFALDGIAYEIDLTGSHALELRKYLERYIDAGTRTGRVGPGAQLSSSRSTYGSKSAAVKTSREENTRIREWATANGHQLAERGRIPQDIVSAYNNRQAVEAKAVALQAETAKPAKPATSVPKPRTNGRVTAAASPQFTPA